MNAAQRRTNARIRKKRDSFITKLIMLGFKQNSHTTTMFKYSREELSTIIASYSGAVYLYKNGIEFGGTWSQDAAFTKIVNMLNESN